MTSTMFFWLLAILTITGHTVLAEKHGDHFIITQAQPITISRMDPIVDHDAVSGHVHKVVGGSAFTSTLNSPDRQIESSCSSAIIGDDKSNYWASQLYYRHTNNTFSPILSSTRIYYFTKSADVKPFPRGLNMISGLSMRRDPGGDESLGIKIACNHGLQTQWLPNGTSHPEGCSAISMGIFFPSCGLANGATSSEDNFSHMAWPVKWLGPNLVKDPNGVTCPESHPIKYPTIFAEFNYYLDEDHPWRNDECTFVLSNGDCTGLNMHADFVEGWVPETMKNVLSECGFGNGPGDELEECAPLAKSKSESATWDCRLEGKIPDEEVGLFRPIPKLPGCNPLWKAGVDEKPTCESNPKPGFVGPNAYFENLKFRIKVPMAFPEAKDDDEIKKFIPALGDTGASRLGRWGTEGSNTNKQTVGSWSSIMSSLIPGTEVPGFGNLIALPGGNESGSQDLSPVDNSTATLISASASPSASASTTSETSEAEATKPCECSSSSSAQAVSASTGSASATGDYNYDYVTTASVSSASTASPATTSPDLDENHNLIAPSLSPSASTSAISKATLTVTKPEQASTTAVGKTCKRKKRGLLSGGAENIKNHLGRRSKRRPSH